MSEFPPGGSDPFGRMIGDILKMMRTDQPVQWELAYQLAQNVAAEGAPEGNVDPIERIRLEELLRIAELHVADITGMAAPSGGTVSVVPVGRGEWARRSLDDWRPLLNDVAASTASASPAEPATGDQAGLEAFGEESDEPDAAGLPPGFAKMLGQWAQVMNPALIAAQVGSITGHLARTTFGQYELPIPRPGVDELLVVPANLAVFASDWSIPIDDLRMWVCLSELAYHAALGRQHVRDRLRELLLVNAKSFQPDPSALVEQFGGLDPTDPESVGRVLGGGTSFGTAAPTPETERARAELSALTATMAGYVEYVAETAGARLISSNTLLREALRRRRVERTEGQIAAEALLGLRLDQDAIDRGHSFVKGVLERGGDAELAKIWVVEANLPTPAEVDAPGLWIERVNLPTE